MHSCQTCQAQMLEHLYDLLDGEERQALEAHLNDCAACRAELAKARAQQDLLAAAARLEFPAVTFTAPAGDLVAAAPAVVLPLQRKPARPLHWRRWAVAAAVLLAVGGLGVAAYWGAGARTDYLQARQTIADKEAAVAEAKKHLRETGDQIHAAPREEAEKIKAVYKALADKQTKLVVVGPATVPAGAPTTFEIQTTNLSGDLVKADVTARVADEQGRQSDPIPVVTYGKGTYRLTLPADLPIKPNAGLTLLVSAKRDAGLETAVSEQLALTAPVYITHLETDKPMYQPGEVVHFRSLTLDRFSLKPAEEDLRLDYVLTTPTKAQHVVLQGSNALRSAATASAGRARLDLLTTDKKPIKGVGAGEFLLDQDLPGGEYILTLREENNRFPEQQRKFIVNRYQKPQLDKKLDFGRTTYGPGDEVTALCKARRAGGEPVRNRPVEASVVIDDKQYGPNGAESKEAFKSETDDQGEVVVRFKLPETIERGQASLAVVFDDGVVESIVRPVPIVLKKLSVDFYPEGGDLVAGLSNRVYFQVRTPLGKPADLTGRILENGKPVLVKDRDGKPADAVQTVHDQAEPGVNQGQGCFQFEPVAHRTYELQIDSPAGIAERFKLPDVKDDGVVLKVQDGVTKPGEPIAVTVNSRPERNLMVGLYCRGRLLSSVQVPRGETAAVLKPTDGIGGVCRVTVFEEQAPGGGAHRELKPVAERLIYRQPTEQLLVTIKPDHASYVPGQKAGLAIQTLDENEKPVPSILMLCVTDKSVVTMADEKTHRLMPTHFLLTSEVRKPEDLEYADFLLGDSPKAPAALDLLLGVQGWRRFAEQNPDKFRERNADKEEAERLLVTIGQSGPRKTDFVEEDVKKVQQDTAARVAVLNEQYDRAEEEARTAAGNPAYLAAVAKTAQYEQMLDRARVIGTPLVGTVLVLAALICLVVALMRNLRRAMPYYAAMATCSALLVGVVVLYRLGGHPAGPGGGQVATAQNDRFGGQWTPPPAPPMEPDMAGNEPQLADRDFAKDDKAGDKPFGAPGFAGAGGGNFPGKRGPGGFPPGGGFAPPPPMAPAPVPGLAPQAEKKDARGAGGPLAKDEGKPADVALTGNAAQDAQQNRKEMEEAAKQFAGLAPNLGAGAKDKKADLAKADGAASYLREIEREQIRGLNQLDRDEFRRMNLDGKGGMGLQPMVVREYAHQRQAGAAPEMRSDFSETLYWHPVLVLPDGKAEVSFDLSDSATTFQATAYAHTADGRLGAVVQTLESRLPLVVAPKTPLEVTAGDKIDVPVTVTNGTADGRDVQLALKAHDGLTVLDGPAEQRFNVAAGAAVRKVYRFQPDIKEGNAVLTFAGKTDAFAPDVRKDVFRVVPEGFPVTGSHSDLLEGSASNTVVLPETWVKGTLKCEAQVYPSTLADLQKGLDSLLREPNGCFEQTSTSNYPNLLILDYLKESDQANPEVERRAREMLSRGYQKLTSFECTNPSKKAREGYEWFGGTAPAHEALTAYGLMQFRDMSRVQDVDAAMMDRTRTYLLSRRDGKGGFLRNPRALDSFGRAPDEVTNAYIVWALTESGKDDDLTKELAALGEQAKTSKDPYFLALVANSLINRAQTTEATALLKTVAAAQKEDGHLDAEKTSITGSGGRDLQIETTALAVLGWLKANPGEFNAPVMKAVKWIGQQRGGYGGFGSTQSTILSLKALIAFTRANKRTPEDGELRLYVGDKEAVKLFFKAGASEALTLPLPEAEKLLHAGRNDVRVEITGKNAFPYTLAWSYQTLKPASPDDCPVRLETKLARTDAKEGDQVRLNVKVENVSGKGQGMAVAIVGLPGGLIVPEDMKQLKDYCREPEDGSRPLVSAFEIRGRELVLYWRDLAPGQKITVPLDLICRVPGEYSGPASRAYLYYNADHKHWVEPLKLTIASKAE